MTKTAAISGLHIRMDVPTKCKLVEQVLTKTFSTKKEQNAYIALIAAQNFVNPVTIKLWCGKYQNTWKFGKTLPDGTMSFAFATLPETKLPTAFNELKDIKDLLAKTTTKLQTKYYSTLTEEDVKTTKTPGKILDELIAAKQNKVH